MPPRPRMRDSDDYLTARAANPRTGLISPSLSSLASPGPRTPPSPLPRRLAPPLFRPRLLPTRPLRPGPSPLQTHTPASTPLFTPVHGLCAGGKALARKPVGSGPAPQQHAALEQRPRLRVRGSHERRSDADVVVAATTRACPLPAGHATCAAHEVVEGALGVAWEVREWWAPRGMEGEAVRVRREEVARWRGRVCVVGQTVAVLGCVGLVWGVWGVVVRVVGWLLGPLWLVGQVVRWGWA